MSAPVSVDDFDTYSKYMHANSIIVLSIGLYTIYLTLCHSTKDMGYYKYYILNFQVAASLFDLHISFIYSPLPIFPAPAICCTSLFAVNANWVFEYVNFIIMHFTLSYVGVSILIGLLYRYYALQGNLSFFHSKKGVALITLFIIIYPVPTVIALVASVTSPEETRYYIQTEYSFYYETFINYCCHAISDPVSMIIYAIFAAIQITFIGSCSVITMFRINHMMKEKKLKLTKKTYDLHKQLIYSLWVQAFLPTCCLALPTVTAFVMIINAFGNLRAVSLTIMPVLCLHSTVLGISTVVMTKRYRQATVKILMKVCILRNRQIVHPKTTSVQVTGSQTHRHSTVF